ncbi:MAG: hypothetical protein EBS05_25295 [Proteobacteria bacterium]|nr:hypothetical protein [Pseudomonadota bacterium]
MLLRHHHPNKAQADVLVTRRVVERGAVTVQIKPATKRGTTTAALAPDEMALFNGATPTGVENT